MELTTAQEIIKNLKIVKREQNLSIPQIKKMVDDTGVYLSMTTLRRVFADNSETDSSFDYERTIRPIAQVLILHNDVAESTVVRAQMDAYDAICRHKDELIDSLKKQIEQLKETHDKRCKLYEDRIDFMRNQIDKKDERMDRKDQMIEKLLNQVLICSHCPVQKDG